MWRFVLEESKCCVHLRLLSAVFCFVYSISSCFGKRPRIRGLLFVSRFVLEKLVNTVHVHGRWDVCCDVRKDALNNHKAFAWTWS